MIAYDTPDQVLSYSQRRGIQLAGLEEQLKLSTSPRSRIDLLSQVLIIKMDLAQIKAINGKGIRI